jgi:L-asparaginase II
LSYLPVFEVTRGDIIESVHHGAIAVADTEGSLIAWHGNPQMITFLRSSAKPFQALPIIESGAATALGLTPKQIAVICASHSGTDMHAATVASVQVQAGIEEGDLQCGVHPPSDPETLKRLEEKGLELTPNRHNCSGKHSGMLALAHFLGESIADYLEPTHAVQRRILETFAEMCGLPQGEVQVGIDGCAAPNFAVPLVAAATAYARLADSSEQRPKLAQACQTVVAAMASHPAMVAGEGSFDTDLMRHAGGRLVSKGGAEGYHGVGVLPGAGGEGSPALGIAVKIGDGNQARRALTPVVLAVLEELGVLPAEARKKLESFAPQPVLNHRKMVVGEGRVCFRLKRDGEQAVGP